MITYIIIGITALLSFNAFSNRDLFFKMQFNAYQVVHRKKYEKLLTHLFIHVDWGHLLFNMISFYFFGRIIEYHFANYFGGFSYIHYLVLYFGAGIASSIPSLLKQKDNIHYNAVGASGSVSAIIYAFIMFHPLEMIYVFFIPLPAIVYGILFLAYSYYMAKKNVDNIGHDAHLWGSLFGVVYIIIFIPGAIQNFFSQLGF